MQSQRLEPLDLILKLPKRLLISSLLLLQLFVLSLLLLEGLPSHLKALRGALGGVLQRLDPLWVTCGILKGEQAPFRAISPRKSQSCEQQAVEYRCESQGSVLDSTIDSIPEITGFRVTSYDRTFKVTGHDVLRVVHGWQDLLSTFKVDLR